VSINPVMNNNGFAAMKSRIQAQNSKVIAHEEAHKSAAGPQAVGTPVYIRQKIAFGKGQSMEAIIGGHQVISIPAPINFTASRSTIDKTIRAAEHTISGAEAPSDGLSDADKTIANRGRQVLFSAKRANMERQQFESKLAENEQNPEQNSKNNKRKPLNILA